MSLVIAVKEDNRFLVGCDTRVTQGCYYSDGYALTKKARMVNNEKNLIVAVAGDLVIADFAESILRNHNIKELTREYIVDDFWPELYQRCLKYTSMDKDAINGELIVIMKDKGFYLDSVGSVMEILDICTIGSGAQIADAIWNCLYENKSYSNKAKIIECISNASVVRNDISNEVYIGSTDGKDFTKYRLK